MLLVVMDHVGVLLATRSPQTLGVVELMRARRLEAELRLTYQDPMVFFCQPFLPISKKFYVGIRLNSLARPRVRNIQNQYINSSNFRQVVHNRSYSLLLHHRANSDPSFFL